MGLVVGASVGSVVVPSVGAVVGSSVGACVASVVASAVASVPSVAVSVVASVPSVVAWLGELGLVFCVLSLPQAHRLSNITSTNTKDNAFFIVVPFLSIKIKKCVAPNGTTHRKTQLHLLPHKLPLSLQKVCENEHAFFTKMKMHTIL